MRRICLVEVMDMVGRLVLLPEVRNRKKFWLEEERLGELDVLRAEVFAPVGLSERRLAWRLRRAERALARAGVGRVILNADFLRERLTRLNPVDTLPLRRECADVLALGGLALEGVEPRRGRVALSSPRLCGELEGAAERLCSQVRGLVIDAPGGEEYARYLQQRFGLPVTPPSAGADVTVAFGPTRGRWGRVVELYAGGCLDGLALNLKDCELPEGYGEQVLALLWEQGRVGRARLCSRYLGIESDKA